MAAHKKLTDEIINQLDELRKTYTMRELATKFNVNISTIYNNSHKEKIITVKSIQEFNRLYNNGATSREISEKYGVSYATVARYIWKPRLKGRRNKQPLIKINGKTIFLKYATEKERFKFYTSSSVGELSKIIDKLVPFSNV